MKLDVFLICDDIRNEIGNKVSLIGVYGDTINFDPAIIQPKVWPRVFRLGVFARFLLEESDRKNPPVSFTVAVEYEGKIQETGVGKIPPAIIDSTLFNLAGVQPAFIIKGLGKYRWNYEFRDRGDKVLASMRSMEIKITENPVPKG